MTHQHRPLSLDSVRARLETARGPEYWRCLEELAGTDEFVELLNREFPRQAGEWTDPVSRRRFFQLMAASLALAGLSACSHEPPTRIVPYVRPPEEIVPGKPLFFATAMTLGGIANGLLVESHMGRPTKVEGNPSHPASRGATDLFAQASVLTLYDPDRSQTVTHLGEISSWTAFVGALNTTLPALRAAHGKGLRLLTETVGSPTLAHQVRGLLKQFPGARWRQYEPTGRDHARGGARLAFGDEAELETRYRFDQARVILALDADFLSCSPGSVRYVRDFSAGRRAAGSRTEMNRLYVVECTPSNTGAKADHRLPLRARDIEGFARAVAARMGVAGAPAAGGEVATTHARWIAALVRDLEKHRGSSIVIAGDQQPPIVHALAHAMNHHLGNAGKTVIYTDPVEARPVDQIESLRTLIDEIRAGAVTTLVIIGGNPVYTAPVDLGFNLELLDKVPLRIHLSLYHDETSRLCHWHVPEAHYLEAWSDGRAYDGTASIVQPLIAPLYGGRSAHELLTAFTEEPDRTGYEIVRGYWHDWWTGQGSSGDFEQFWRQSLNQGVVPHTELAAKTVSLKPGWADRARAADQRRANPESEADQGIEIVFRPDPAIWDGRFANNGWLQELPKPLTRLTWDNAVLVSPTMAERLGLGAELAPRGGSHGHIFAPLVELQYRGRSVPRAPVLIMPGHPDDSVTVHLGYGRTRSGRVGTGTGFDAYAIRTSDAPWFGSGLEIVKLKTAEPYSLACVQYHNLIDMRVVEARHVVRSGTFEHREELEREIAAEKEKLRDPGQAGPKVGGTPSTPSLYPNYAYGGYAWGMAIDMNACVGCSACVVACQAENNIPVVGKPEVLNGREMHWLRIDHYYKGGPDNPQTYFQPLPCMQCENAPCELVCPVGATVHSSEGLNDMVYNRCVGTRYCSNNCPYKVRRFNFFQYADYVTPSLKLLHNPEVTVRTRGVMEKCTYCVQRISAARIEAEKQDREIRDGEVVTACQAACPARAIIFGNINDPNSRVSKLKADPLNYGLLAELNTRPRTTYLAALRNPNPEIEAAER